MTRLKLPIIGSVILCYLLQAQGADKYTDENRPYEFGFTIDGQQHRHEEKDSKGIIKGEYGFITADDVYHVTVYATDEQGRFKILSMKNIRYRDYIGRTPSNARQGKGLASSTLQPVITSQPPSPTSAGIVAGTPKPAQELETISIEPPVNSCSHCSLPTTSTAAPVVSIPVINHLNGASGSPKSPDVASPNTGSTQFSTPYAYSQGQYNRNRANGFNQNQGSFTPNQGFQQRPPASGQQNNNAAQSVPQQPNESEKPFGFNGESNLDQKPNVPSQQIAPSGQQFTPGVQQSTLGGPQIFTGGSQVTSNGQPGGLKSISRGKQFTPGRSQAEQQITPSGQFTPNEQQIIPAGPQIALGEPQIAVSRQQITGGQQFAPSGQQFPPSGQPITSGGQQTAPVGLQPYNSEKTRSGKQYTGPPILSTPQYSEAGGSGPPESSFKPQKPTLAYAQMQIVDKNTDIHAKQPGEKDGLPPGVKEDDVLNLLYTFNYTLGFQAHFEEGYTNGVKRGYYYTTGRNGLRTRIDYVADENGFRPTLSQEVFDLLSDDVPKADTEREEKYGLKGYEFKWLYFPPDTTSQ